MFHPFQSSACLLYNQEYYLEFPGIVNINFFCFEFVVCIAATYVEHFETVQDFDTVKCAVGLFYVVVDSFHCNKDNTLIFFIHSLSV